MTFEYDVVVIGGGIAGRMAALSAADEGVSVAIITSGDSTLPTSTGLVDVLGYTPRSDGPLARPFEHLSALSESHPYSTLGESTIRAAFERFDSAVGDFSVGGHTDANALVATPMGTPKPTARYPRSFAKGLLSREGDVLLVGFESLSGFDAAFAATELSRAEVPVRTQGVNIDLFGDLPVEQPRLRLASALDVNEDFPPDSNRPVRERLASMIAPNLEGESRVGVPAVLGLENTGAIRADLEAELGAEVFEVPMAPPSIPGRRLETELATALDRHSVEHLPRREVDGFEERNGRVSALSFQDRPGRIRGSQFVLATGGLIGGGLVDGGDGVRERIFDLPVACPDSEQGWHAADPLSPQPFARVGLSVDGDLRPIGGETSAFSNMYACGDVLGGFDPVTEHSGSGVAIATGYGAGRRAARSVIQ